MSEPAKHQSENHLNDWMKKIHDASFKHQAPLEIDEKSKEGKESLRNVSAIKSYDHIIIGFFLLLGLLYRLVVIFFITGTENAGVGWYGDTYHHWQIAYLTKTTGFSHGFLRLWDLKGMEYFWGLLHPLLMNFLFLITGSTNIILSRMLSTGFGLASVYMLFLLGMRYFGRRVAYAIAFFSAFFSIAVFNDASGMLEPIGLFFMLLGIYTWPRLPFMTAISFVLASMVRAEMWVFSIGLLFGILIKPGNTHRKTIVILLWSIFMVLYMKYFLDHTGNAIYPIYWNFLANALGEWAGDDPLTSLQLTVRPILMVIGAISAVMLGFIIYKRPKNILLLLLGFGNIFFVTSFMGFGHYIHGWEWWFPVIRFFVFPYMFAALMLFALINKLRIGSQAMVSVLVMLAVGVLTVTTQLAWVPILQRFKETRPEWERSISWGREVGKYYKEGTLLFPDGDPHFTYTSVQYGHVEGQNILSQMFDPFYYIDEDQVFGQWSKYKKAINNDWIKKHDIRLAVFRTDTERYIRLIEKEPEIFEKVSTLEGGVYEIWRIYPEKIR